MVIADHHKMVITALKVYIKKFITINYRSYKDFDIPHFRNDLKQNLETFDKKSMNYEDFEIIYIGLLTNEKEGNEG